MVHHNYNNYTNRSFSTALLDEKPVSDIAL